MSRKGFKNRIVGSGEEKPDQLLANPKNWRIHPKHQEDGLASVLDSVGWVQSVTVNRTTGFVVDGHLRVSLAISRGEPTIPVSYVELSESEEALVLATLDPLSAMANSDDAALMELLRKAGEFDATADLVESIQLSLRADEDAPSEFSEIDPDNMEFEFKCPRCHYEWSGDKAKK